MPPKEKLSCRDTRPVILFSDAPPDCLGLGVKYLLDPDDGNNDRLTFATAFILSLYYIAERRTWPTSRGIFRFSTGTVSKAGAKMFSLKSSRQAVKPAHRLPLLALVLVLVPFHIVLDCFTPPLITPHVSLNRT